MNRSVSLLAPLLVAPLLLAGCAKKAEPKAAVSEDAPKAESIEGAKFPDDKTSEAFAEKLIRVEAKDFKPTDASGAGFIYKTIDFRADNTWWAQAQMSADGETIDCKEQGTWEMDAATDEHTAPMTWKLDRTTCAGRPSEAIMRVKVNIDKGEYRIVFR